MNDGPAPQKRSAFSVILPYILMIATVGLFIWLIVSSSVGKPVEWARDQIDENVGYSLVVDEEGKVEGQLNHETAKYRVYAVQVTQGYKAVSVTGGYIDSDNRLGTFTVRIEEEAWAGDSELGGFVYIDADGNKGTHAYYSTIFQSCVDYAKAHPIQGLKENNYFYQVLDGFEVSWWDSWGPTIVMLVITVLLAFWILSRLNKSVSGMNNSAFSFNKSPARKANSKVRFTDVAGCDEEKAEMVELVEYLKDPHKYSKFGARLPKGVLLIGPPGTGKTLLAKAVAGEAGVPFYSISGSDFVEMYVGVGAGRVRDLFRRAKETAPCLIFIDEIDAVGRQRGAGLGGGNDEREQTLNQLLVEMDGFEANSGILVIAATNRDDVLDPALRRAGRFDRTITVSLPDKAGREAIFKVHAKNKILASDVDFAALAKRTVGFSGADIDNVLNEAAILAVRENKPAIDLSDIDEAIDRRISGPAKSSRSMSEQERKEVAYHEAGHAVIGINLPFSDKVQKITIIPRGNTGGHVLMTPEDDRFLLTKNELIARITGLLGGRTSEEIFFQDVTTGASNDIEQATRLARLMVTEFGMSDLGPIQYEKDTGSVFLGRDYNSTQRNFSTQIAFEIDKAVRRIIEEAHEKARELLLKYKDQVVLIAETLLEKETITAEEIEYLCAHGTLPPKPEPKPVESPIPTGETPLIPPVADAEPAEDKPAEEKPADKPSDDHNPEGGHQA